MTGPRTYFIPGFGCSYVSEFDDLEGEAPFCLKFNKQGEQFSFIAEVPQIFFLLEASRAKVIVGEQEFLMDHTHWLFLAKGQKAEVSAKTFVLKTARIGWRQTIQEKTIADYHLQASKLAQDVLETHGAQRSFWIEELCHRYVFERSIAQEPESYASLFCQKELLKEYYYQCRHREVTSVPLSPRHAALTPGIQKVLALIEAQLHESLELKYLCKTAGLSESALVRQFRKELGTTPMRYVWRRRLEEARVLLASGRYRVKEVAEHVGFSDVSSFSQAFSREFNEAPSSVRVFE